MDADDILAADSMDDYVFDPATVTIDPWYGFYLVCYGWTLTPPEQWSGGSGEQERIERVF